MYLSSKVNIFPCLILEEAPSLYVEAYNVTTSTAVIRWQPLRKAESVVDFTGYRVSLQSERDTSRVNLVNTNVSSLLFDGLHTFTNYCVTVEPLTVLASTRVEDCYDFVTEEDGKAAYNLFQMSRDISNRRDSVSSGYANIEKRVQNTTRSGVFLTKVKAFG